MTANIRTVRKDNSEYHAVQVAASDRPYKTTTNQMIGHFKKAGVSPKRFVREFPVTPDAHVPVGESLNALRHHKGARLKSRRNYIICDTFRSGAICGCDCEWVCVFAYLIFRLADIDCVVLERVLRVV